MKTTRLYIGIKEAGEKQVQTFRSLRLDLFHSVENVKAAVDKWIDEIYDNYGDVYDPGEGDE